MTRDRRGFTLIELLIVVVLGSLILAAALQVLITNQRTYTAQNAAITGQQATRMALDVLFTLREYPLVYEGSLLARIMEVPR